MAFALLHQCVVDLGGEVEQAALAEGERALIHKPNDVAELCATVDRLAHER